MDDESSGASPLWAVLVRTGDLLESGGHGELVAGACTSEEDAHHTGLNCASCDDHEGIPLRWFALRSLRQFAGLW